MKNKVNLLQSPWLMTCSVGYIFKVLLRETKRFLGCILKKFLDLIETKRLYKFGCIIKTLMSEFTGGKNRKVECQRNLPGELSLLKVVPLNHCLHVPVKVLFEKIFKI